MTNIFLTVVVCWIMFGLAIIGTYPVLAKHKLLTQRISNAHAENILDCLKTKLTNAVHEVNSVSDSAIVRNTVLLYNCVR